VLLLPQLANFCLITSNLLANTANPKLEGPILGSLFRNNPLAGNVIRRYVYSACRAANAAFCSAVAAN